MLDTIFIGVDVSSQTNAVYVMDQSGNKVWTNSFDNSRDGSEALLDQLLGGLDRKQFFRFGLEATGCYGSTLAMFLRETPRIPPK